tara:strand:+ start:1607 stop:1834 length:228 start_codon:yes stop_codon:yes gene_type:complete
VNGRIARKLRKVLRFNPHDERFYKQIKNANNFVVGENGKPERIGGTWLETTKEGSLVTVRSKYKYMKEQYYDRAF